MTNITRTLDTAVTQRMGMIAIVTAILMISIRTINITDHIIKESTPVIITKVMKTRNVRKRGVQ